jgi:uncharacterized protein (DUF58 family)
MKLRPGPNLIVLACALVVLVAANTTWSWTNWLVAALVLSATAGAAADWAVLRQGLSRVQVARSLPAVAGRGRVFQVKLTLDYTGRWRLHGEARDAVAQDARPSVWWEPLRLSPRQTSRLAAGFQIAIRGRHRFGPVWLRLRGPCGMLEGQRSWPVDGEIKILPETFHDLSRLAVTAMDDLRLLDALREVRQRGIGTEFESLDEFRTGDDPRRLDWRATARLARPIVRRFQVERHRDVMILVDAGRLMGADAEQGTKLDAAVDAALRLARVALAAGDRCGIGIYDDQVRGYLPPRPRLATLDTVVESLFDLAPRWRESDFGVMFATLSARQPQRALVVVLSDLVNTGTSQRLRSSLAAMARRHVVLFAAVQTPWLRHALRDPVAGVLDAARRAVVLRSLRDRERALFDLSRGGVDVLDVTPAELTVPLLNRYIALRGGNRL